MTGAADVVVIGAGLAGLSAGVRAAELGCRVIVLERGGEDAYLCNSRYTGGLFHVAVDDMRAAPERIFADVVRITDGAARADLAQAIADNAGRTLDWLRSQGVRFIRAGPAGWQQNSLAPPGVQKTGLNWQGRAGDVMLRTLGAALARHGGRLLRGAEATGLKVAAGRIAGVTLVRDGAETTLACAAVVIADGGFQGNADLMRRFVSPAPERLLMRNAGTGRGTGIRLGESIGARLVGTENVYGHIHARDAMTSPGLWPYPLLDFLATAGIVVTAAGERFCDEGRGGIYITNAIARLDDPLSTTVIIDDAIWHGPATEWLIAANPHLLRADGRLVSAPDLAGLADRLGLSADRLVATIDDHNAAIAGTADFVPPRTSAPYRPWPIAVPPYHAVPLCAGVTYTMGGLAIDAGARVLDKGDRPIPGLFAAGGASGGLEGGPHAGYTGGLSKASVFGLLAGEGAAAQAGNLSAPDHPTADV